MVPFSIIFVGEFCVTIYTNGENDNNRGEKVCYQGRLTNNLYLCP